MRPTLLQILSSNFSECDFTYDDCRKDVIKKVGGNNLGRLFDEFPPLLCQKDMTALRNRYVNIIRTIDPQAITTDYTINAHRPQKDDIYFLVKDIAQVAWAQLYDEEHHLKTDWLVFLKLEALIPTLAEKPHVLISAYLSACMGIVQILSSSYIHKYEKAYKAVNQYIDQYKTAWVSESGNFVDTTLDLSDAIADKAMKEAASKHAADTAAIVVGVGVGAAVLIGAGVLFKAVAQRSDPTILTRNECRLM